MQRVSDLLSHSSAFFRKPKTVKEALRQIVPWVGRELELAALDGTNNLIELVARREGLDSGGLLEEIARRLGVHSARQLVVPPPTLWQHGGFAPETLKRATAILQPLAKESGRFAIAVADTTVLNLDAFRTAGIPVYLALPNEITRIWDQLDARPGSQLEHIRLPLPVVEQVVRSLAEQIRVSGAQMLRIGGGDPSRYEFPAGREQFSGSIHPGIYWTLREILERRIKWEIVADGDTDPPIVVSLLQDGPQPTVLCGWTLTDLPLQQLSLRVLGVVEQSVQVNFEASFDATCGASEKNCDGKFRQILIVDDDHVFVRLLGDMLVRRGYSVACRYSAASAKTWLADSDLINCVMVSDVHLPDLHGQSLIEYARAQFPALRILTLSSDGSSETGERMMAQGADAFLAKHVDAQTLLNQLECWFSEMHQPHATRALTGLGACEDVGAVGDGA